MARDWLAEKLPAHLEEVREAISDVLQQFDGATTWRELAQATRSCVESLEQRMHVRPPSQPQIFVGASVAGLRIPGR